MFFMFKWYYVITILSPPVSGPDQPQAGLRQGGHLTHRHEPFHTVRKKTKIYKAVLYNVQPVPF